MFPRHIQRILYEFGFHSVLNKAYKRQLETKWLRQVQA
jgi:hypothetical protein